MSARCFVVYLESPLWGFSKEFFFFSLSGDFDLLDVSLLYHLPCLVFIARIPILSDGTLSCFILCIYKSQAIWWEILTYFFFLSFIAITVVAKLSRTESTICNRRVVVFFLVCKIFIRITPDEMLSVDYRLSVQTSLILPARWLIVSARCKSVCD